MATTTYKQERWSLEDLFPEIDSPEMQETRDQLEDLVQKIEGGRDKLAPDMAEEEFVQIIDSIELASRLLSRLFGYGLLRFYGDTQDQNAQTGHITGGGHGSMYHHGFAMLALSEAYGVVNERLLWQGSEVPVEGRRTVGQALELAVRCALTAQKKNPFGAWRYSPDSQDADTTVSGTVLMGLLGAKNAGIEVPNEAIEKALSFFKLNTMRDGNVSYQPAQSHGDGICRASIATLVYAVAKRKDLPEYKAAAGFIRERMDQDINQHPFYTRYYMAQALFQSDLEAWKIWNQRTIEKLGKMQKANGSIPSPYGPAYGTGMSVLALALNYRLLPVYER